MTKAKNTDKIGKQYVGKYPLFFAAVYSPLFT